ncbi:hypothetical protein [Staphylococcus pettenkoferi]|uniref:hypothetical protein n=1 Tax=Staphylococcus pettenkoferi TaxID=170573 RepID=UPI00227321FA|nr:hypothetical protein [Staphylococcus pettenkoferi]MCY1587470.1 hypothetical protein [Staphylococcus pettenkoferi]
MCKRLKHAKQTVYNVINAFKEGLTVIDFYQHYKRNKSRCGRKKISLPKDQTSYIQEKVNHGWSSDAILGRKEKHVNCSLKTLYRTFQRVTFPTEKLAIKGKCKPNYYKEVDFNKINDEEMIKITRKLNQIPRKSLNYLTPEEKFLSLIEDEKLSSLI